jgi:formate dehydrogenase subunit beta
MKTSIPVQDHDVLAALRGFLKSLFDAGVVDALFVPLETAGGAVMPAMVTDPELLKHANPLAPVMPINGARAVSALTGKHPPVRLGAVLRPCEMRALIELVKLQQASLEGVTLIGLDCPGTYEMTAYNKLRQNGGFDLSGYLASASAGQDAAQSGLVLRPACQMCIQTTPSQAAVHIHLFGADLSAGIPVEVEDGLAALLSLQPFEGTDQRKAIIEKVEAAHKQVRDRELKAIRTSMMRTGTSDSNGGVAGLFENCIRCHNCMTACPICYCKTCLFRTSAFDHQPEHYMTAARRKGAVRMLGDTLLFQMTRMNHMSISCVSCGMCTSACPVDIPVGAIFSAVAEPVQAAFEYEPGRNLEEPLPLITFQANEWTEVGEAK